jgi:predicted ATPase
VDAVARYVADREMLLVVDNVEQVVEAAPSLGRLLDAAPRLSILATSRIPLHLAGEQEYRVEPLGLPGLEQGADVHTAAGSESVALFLARAEAVEPRFRLDEENVADVVDIVRRVDGLPLAIELAAGQLRLLSPRRLRARLEQRLHVLTGGPRDAPARQRTLRSTIEWSHDQLGPDEQRLFARLAVFRGGWTIESAEAVCASGLTASLMNTLGSLVDTSLVRHDRSGDDDERFGMLETILEFATERLAASGELDEMRRRHAAHVLDLAEEAEPHLLGDDDYRWMDRLEAEHDNIRAALDWAEAGGNMEAGLRTGASLWRFWVDHAHLTEARGRLERLLVLPGAQDRTIVRARALGALGSVAYWQADYDASRHPYQEAADIARDAGDRRSLSRALMDLSYVPLFTQGDLQGAQHLLDQALEAAPEDDLVLRAQIWQGIGYLQMWGGDPAAAIDSIAISLAVHRKLGNRSAVAENMVGLATLQVMSGDPEAAWSILREAVALLAELGSPLRGAPKSRGRSRPLAMAVVCRAILAGHSGDHLRAARLLGAWSRFKEEGSASPPPVALAPFGDLESTTRMAIGGQAFERAWAEGYAMTPEAAWVDVLEEEPASPR